MSNMVTSPHTTAQKADTEALTGVSVVIPCLNEEHSIAEVIQAAWDGLALLGLHGEIIVVDNGCTDRTASIAREHGARVVREDRRGYGAAIRRGFSEALFDILVMGDGDLTYDFRELNKLVQPVVDGTADFVIGNRMKNIRPGSMPALHRFVGNPLLSLLLRLLFGSHAVRDAHCGLRAIRRDSCRALKCLTTGMEFASEMVIAAIRNDLRIVEIKIVYHPRVGDSKLRSFKDGWRHLRFMLLHSPAIMLLVPGAIVWLTSMALALPLAFGPVVMDGRKVDLHFMLMAGMLNLISVQFITSGMLAKAFAHLTGLRRDPVVAWFYRWCTFEKVMIGATLLCLTGFVIAGWIVFGWAGTGFSDLDKARPLFFALLSIVNGVQLGCSSYLFSALALPITADNVSPGTDEGNGTPP